MQIEHGGTDNGPPIRSDFSTNAHPLGPNPFVLAAVRRADRSRYPDPSYTAVRERLAELHRVGPERIVVGGSASELIWRLALAWREDGGRDVVTKETTFAEYRRAAHTLGLRVLTQPQGAALRFICDPDNPSGASCHITAELPDEEQRSSSPTVVDLAYHPFRTLLSGNPDEVLSPLAAAWADAVIQLWSPNKLHALTGVRAAFLVLPAASVSAEALIALAPSWVVSAEGVALLTAHAERPAGNFLVESAVKLRSQKERCESLLEEAGWERQPSSLHYGLYRPPVALARQRHWFELLRVEGIKVRDATSFGRPGWVRLAARPPDEVARLIALTDAFRNTSGMTGGAEHAEG
jgi:histidinol-phosphate aminotransferase